MNYVNQNYVNHLTNDEGSSRSAEATYGRQEQHKLKSSKQDDGNVMQVTIEFNPDGDNQAVWERVKAVLLSQYLERTKIGSMQMEPEALYSSPLEGNIEKMEEKTDEEG